MKVTPVAGARSATDLRPTVLDALRILKEHGAGQHLANIVAVVGHLLPREPPGLALAVARTLDRLEHEGRVRSVLTPGWRVYLLPDQPPGGPQDPLNGPRKAREPPGAAKGPQKAATG